MKNKYSILHGNIGEVCCTENGFIAWREYRRAIGASKAGYGRGSGEPVTLFLNGDIRAEYNPPAKKNKLPTIKEIAALLRDLKPTIGDDYRASDDADDNLPGMQITIGIDPEDGSWSYQTGDNSYTGGAYGYQYWGVGALYRRTNCRTLARELINDAAEQMDWSEQ